MQRLASNFRLIFAIFVVLGGAIILTLSTMARGAPERSQTHWIMMASVIGLMAVFGVVVWIRSKSQHASDFDAEAFYYLGFIYTLITLVATFTPLLAEGGTPSTKQVLGLFGLGLITTFVGLTGRVFFLQARAALS